MIRSAFLDSTLLALGVAIGVGCGPGECPYPQWDDAAQSLDPGAAGCTCSREGFIADGNRCHRQAHVDCCGCYAAATTAGDSCLLSSSPACLMGAATGEGIDVAGGYDCWAACSTVCE